MKITPFTSEAPPTPLGAVCLPVEVGGSVKTIPIYGDGPEGEGSLQRNQGRKDRRDTKVYNEDSLGAHSSITPLYSDNTYTPQRVLSSPVTVEAHRAYYPHQSQWKLTERTILTSHSGSSQRVLSSPVTVEAHREYYPHQSQWKLTESTLQS